MWFGRATGCVGRWVAACALVAMVAATPGHAAVSFVSGDSYFGNPPLVGDLLNIAYIRQTISTDGTSAILSGRYGSQLNPLPFETYDAQTPYGQQFRWLGTMSGELAAGGSLYVPYDIPVSSTAGTMYVYIWAEALAGDVEPYAAAYSDAFLEITGTGRAQGMLDLMFNEGGPAQDWQVVFDFTWDGAAAGDSMYIQIAAPDALRITSVPEPASAGLLGIAAAAMLVRRRPARRDQ